MKNDAVDLIIVNPPTYARALAITLRADPPGPIAKAIVSGITRLQQLMREQEACCAVCDDDDVYVFAVAEPPLEFLCCVPAEGSDAEPIAGPICEQCAKLSDAEKADKIRASMRKAFPGSRSRKLH